MMRALTFILLVFSYCLVLRLCRGWTFPPRPHLALTLCQTCRDYGRSISTIITNNQEAAGRHTTEVMRQPQQPAPAVVVDSAGFLRRTKLGALIRVVPLYNDTPRIYSRLT
jgi:hypothetical protein